MPVNSTEGKDYLNAMRRHFAWANRQCITHRIRETFQQVFDKSWEELGIRQVYDVSHNIAKIERHTVDGVGTDLCVHRKGATRSFPSGSGEIPAKYRDVGQPVLILGDMAATLSSP